MEIKNKGSKFIDTFFSTPCLETKQLYLGDVRVWEMVKWRFI